jgi:hypothetical protein
VVEQRDHAALVHPDQTGRLHDAGRGHAQRLGREAALAEEAPAFEDADDGLLAARGDDRELDLAALDEEDGVGRVSLREDDLLASIRPGRLPLSIFVRKTDGSTARSTLLAMDSPPGPDAFRGGGGWVRRRVVKPYLAIESALNASSRRARPRAVRPLRPTAAAQSSSWSVFPGGARRRSR